jgi:dTDP-4-amino-4,6-dideoxygalactose transaminase
MKTKEINNRTISFMKPSVPPIDDFQKYLDKIWDSRILTNGGPLQTEFETALCNYLGVEYICLLSSGTLALALALKSLELKGEVITTPFTSVATIQAIYWNNLTPVFADINENDLTIDPDRIEEAITPITCAILPVHVFGNPCQTEKINTLARIHNLKVLYDAAHCFGVKINGESITKQGDLSVLSFHATKVFNTIEGGAIICHDAGTRDRINTLKNTGLNHANEISAYGLNAKMNEFQAAFGLAQLDHIDRWIESRKAATYHYRELLGTKKGLRLMSEEKNITYNYPYLPLIVDAEEFGATRDEVADSLARKGVFTKKYFYPLTSDSPLFNSYKTRELPVAGKIAENILCLPLYNDISPEEIKQVAAMIIKLKKRKKG